MKKHKLFLFIMSLLAFQMQGMYKRQVAFLMAGHPRLGQQSPTAVLPAEILRNITEIAFPELELIRQWRTKSQAERNNALLDAANTQDIKQALILLDAGTDVNALNMQYHITPLLLASWKGNIKLVQILLAAGADITIKAVAGDIILHIAVNKGHLEVVNTLLAAGANVNQAGYNNNTPLHNAAQNGNKELVQLLLENGANPYALNNNERTPEKLARQHDYDEVGNLIQNYAYNALIQQIMKR